MFRQQLLRQSRALSRSLTQTSPQLRTQSFSSISSRSSRTLAASSSSLGRRWKSTDSTTQTEGSGTQTSQDSQGAKTADAKDGKSVEPEADNPLKAELEKKNKEVIDLKDKYLRSVADFRNLQERTKRDMESARQFAIQRFATDLLDSIDNLDRALSSVPAEALGQASEGTTSNTSSMDANKAAATESTASLTSKKELVNLHSGLKMSESILLSTLKKHGLERFDPMEGEGRKFDPNTDEATFFTKVEGKKDGDVFYTQSKGFKLNGRVIRAAKVGVVKNS